MNILIVDDHPSNLRLLRAQLEAESHAVFEAPDGVDALALLECQPVDAVITDILMPRMDGYRLCHEIRKRDRLRYLPILIYTATYNSPADEKLALDVGADKYLTKPASTKIILDGLNEIMGKPHAAPRPETMKEVEVLKEYSERLVNKLEEKNTELEAAQGKIILQATAMSTAANAILITDHAGRITWVNEAFTTMTGYAAGEAIGKTPRLLKSGRHEAAYYHDFWKTISSGQTWRGEFTNRRKDGSLYCDDHTVTPVRDSAGKITHYIGILHDVTARKQAEDALARRVRLAALVAEVSVALTRKGSLREVLLGCTESMVTHLDAAFARIWTLNEAANVLELKASSGMYSHLDGPHGRVPVGQFKIGLIAQERQPHLTNSVVGDPCVGEQEWAKREGMVAFAGYPLIVEDRLVGVVALFARHQLSEATLVALSSVADGIASGIERKRAEEALRESEERFRELAGNLDQVFWMTDKNFTKILYVSPAYEKIWGRTCQSWYERPMSFAEAVRPEDRERLSAMLEQQKCGKQTEEEFRILRPDGLVRWIRNRAFPVLNDAGEFYRTAGVAEDITDRKQLEAQFLRSQRMESVGSLAGGIAHDLNNALAPILMASEFLKMTNTDADKGRILDTIYESASRGAGMVKQILTFARGSEGERGLAQPQHLVREMIDIARHTFPKAIQIRTDLAPDTWTLLGNPTQLHQILLNLCVNARDAMPTGGTLTLATRNVRLDAACTMLSPDAKPGPYVLLTVTDTGTGMTPEVRARIFDVFFTTKAPGKGTGLGLSTILNIARDHGGFLTVDSALGKGTTFKVYLPAQETTGESAVEAAPPALPMGQGELILLVDDEAAIRSIVTQTLQAFGYRVVTANDGAHAVVICAQNLAGLQLLITDMAMPIMDGKTTIRAIRAILPRLPVIVASGSNSPESAALQKEHDVQAFLRKPFSADDLLHTVHEVLQGAG